MTTREIAIREFTKEVEVRYHLGLSFQEAFKRALEAHGIRLN